MLETHSDVIEHQSSDKDPRLGFLTDIFQALGMPHVLDNQFTFCADRLKCSVLSKLQHRFNQFWRTTKEENQFKMSFYATITQGQMYRTEPYLLVNTRPEFRKVLCRLRISAHDLQIERYSDTARVVRTCRTRGVVEDELHFLNEYICYNLLRQRLLNNPHVRDLYTNGTRNNSYRPSDLLRLDKAQMYLAQYT